MASANNSEAFEADIYSYLNEAGLSKEKLVTEDFRTKDNITQKAQTSASYFNKMASLRYLLMTLALLSVFIVSLSSAAAVRPMYCHGQTAEEIRFQELLATVSDDDLHKVLEEHVASKYKPGVWREGRTAMSAVHKDDAAKATSLIQLARRQNVSMTTDVEAATPSETTIVVPPTTTDAEPSTTPDSGSTTSDQPAASETTTEPTQDPTTSAEPTATSTSPSESVIPTSEPTTTETSTKAESTSTIVQTTTTRSSLMTTSRASSVRSTSDVETTTAGEEIESSTTQEVVFTTVKPDGSRSTITSYTIVPAAEATQDAPADPTFTPEVQDAATSLSGAGLLGFAIISLTAVMVAF